ncbi:MAG: hypothetical protein KBT09_10020 [Bacteroidales bacterium]|nr:hypothetical protein [Candidatus Sodaliphilus fimicaballi]
MKRISLILIAILALLAQPANAEVKQMMLVFTDTAGVRQMIPLESVKSMTFDNDVIEEVKGGHAVVDLGLSVKWAYSNLDINADNLEVGPYNYSDALYGWADPTGLKRSTDAKDYPSEEECGSPFAPETIVSTKFDIAHVKWGSDWRLPSDAELKELVSSCTWEWETVNGTNGYRVTGPNGNSIFLPCNGWRHGATKDAKGVSGFYWSGTVSHDSLTGSRNLAFNSNVHNTGYSNREYGFSIRPVVDKAVDVLGDVNGDGIVDIADVNAATDMILGLQDATAVADVNGDGTVDVADMNAIIDIVLGL